MSGIVGSRLNIRGSGVVGKLGTDGQVLTSSGAGASAVFESAGGGAVSAINNATANELVTIGSTTTELDSETNLIYNGTILGAGATGASADLGVGIHIRTGDSGASVASNADELVIEGSSVSGMSILSANDSNGRISFGDDGDNDIGFIRYNHADNSFNFTTNAAQAINIDSTGAVTKPLQPCVLAGLGVDVAYSGTDSNPVPFNIEVFDVNADYNNSTYTFTAPVTGKYLIHAHCNTLAARGSSYNYTRIITSNREYYTVNTPSDQVTGNNYYSSPCTAVADMDASDTCTIHFATDDDSSWTLRADAGNTWLSICLIA